jgi:RimJ/RimL family protein N-acetyltransferase
MRREGHIRENVRKAGEWRDTYLYALLKDEWEKAQWEREGIK